jgi:dipeptidyl aminopeptidase/acylaminoacyl peptidase
MLTHPEFYKVAVSGAGNHDQRGYHPIWGETYNGPDDGKNYLESANATLAKNLRGKLLLIHGDMDDNVHPFLTMQVVDALIKANKDFDMLIVPNAGHGVMMSGYAQRRQWDYFVRHLLGAEPPADYQIGRPVGAGE